MIFIANHDCVSTFLVCKCSYCSSASAFFLACILFCSWEKTYLFFSSSHTTLQLRKLIFFCFMAMEVYPVVGLGDLLAVGSEVETLAPDVPDVHSHWPYSSEARLNMEDMLRAMSKTFTAQLSAINSQIMVLNERVHNVEKSPRPTDSTAASRPVPSTTFPAPTPSVSKKWNWSISRKCICKTSAEQHKTPMAKDPWHAGLRLYQMSETGQYSEGPAPEGVQRGMQIGHLPGYKP